MKETFQISQHEITRTQTTTGNLIIYKNVPTKDEQSFLKHYQLPKDVFYFDELSPIAPRYEKIQNELLGETIIFVLANVVHIGEKSVIEHRLESHVFILGEEKLFWFIKGTESNLNQTVLEKHQEDIHSLQSVLVYAGLQAYTNFTKELNQQKDRIDQLNEQANQTTSNRILLAVTETERNLIMLEHTIYSQEDAFERLLKDEKFLEKLNNNLLVHDIKWYNRQVKKLVHVYRDLFDAVSSLFSAIVSNNLNKLMKFLSSLSLILAASGFIAELWGMNTGGLFFENHAYGTHIMIFIAFVAGLSMYLFLKNKKFFDDD
jgi:magnesium transporter